MTDEKALRVSDYLSHIIDAAQRIATYTAGMGREQFLASSLVQDAVIRNLEVLPRAVGVVEAVGDWPASSSRAHGSWGVLPESRQVEETKVEQN